jgi:polysaccharide deacetylase 2 family uncharacterized protein YibQ
VIYIGETGADREAASRELKSLGASALKGPVLGKAYVSDAAIDAIREWALELDESGVALAPASEVLRARAGRG